MGFRVLLVKIEGKSPDAIHKEFAVTPTNKYEEIPESLVVGAELPKGGYLLFINDKKLPDEKVLADLSRDAAVMANYVNETVMFSSCAAWANGVWLWSVTHNNNNGLQHLETSGAVPEILLAIRKQHSEKQTSDSEVDYFFDIPVELFTALGGQRYNYDIPGAGPKPWQELRWNTH